MALTTFRLDPNRVAWRIVDGRVLAVSRATGHLYRLDRAGTEVWLELAAASPDPVAIDAIVESMTVSGSPPLWVRDVESFLCELELAGLLESRSAAVPSAADPAVAGSTLGAPLGLGFSASLGPSAVPAVARIARRPRSRRIADTWEVAFEIEAAPGALVQIVGDGYLMRSPEGSLELLAAEAALLWRLVSSAPRTFVELLDALCERDGGSYEDAERIALPLIARWSAAGTVRGLEQVVAVREAARGARQAMDEVAGEAPRTAGGARPLGRLDLMRLAAAPSHPPSLGASPMLQDRVTPVEHVAIVCQYGIHGLAPGVEPYTQRCIARLRALQPDLVILSGGGRHGLSDLREAESVIDRYRALLPGPALWLEKHSETTWENLQRSLELLLARSIVPRRITLLGDRARAEKLRLACWLARRRFAAFGAVDFRVAPVERPRFTWKDSRSVQIVVGTAQILHESRGARLVTAMGPAVAGEGSA